MFQKVRLNCVGDKNITGEIIDSYQDDDGAWFYTLDRRNYLHESMLEEIGEQTDSKCFWCGQPIKPQPIAELGWIHENELYFCDDSCTKVALSQAEALAEASHETN